jgi:phosphate transport system substrate-binding protein
MHGKLTIVPAVVSGSPTVLLGRLTGLLLAAFVACDPAAAQTLTIAGSTSFNTAVLTPHQKEIEAATGLRLVALPNKTDVGLKLLAERRADVGMISTSLDLVVRELRQAAPELPLDQLKSFEVFSAVVAFTVHPSNPVRAITSDALKKVLLGETANWNELGGPDLPIRVVSLDSGGGIPLTLETELLDGRPIAAKDRIRVRISSQVAKVVEQEPGALGLTQAGNLPGRNVVVLKTDRVFAQRLSYVTLGDPSPPVRLLIATTRKIMQNQ